MADGPYQQGMEIRQKVLGKEHVAKAEADKTGLDERFQRYISESVWGGVWNNDSIDVRTRSLLTICLLAALGHREELAMHLRATRNTGVTKNEVCEALMHVAAYAGVPAANRAFAVAKDTFSEIDDDR